MRHLIKVLVIFSFVVFPSEIMGQDTKQSFDEFRKSILGNYNDYRTEILSQYGKYLDSLWVEYPQYAGVERNPFPKPKAVPVAEDTEPTPSDEVPPMPGEKPGIGDTTVDAAEDPILPQVDGKISLSFYGIPLTMCDVNYEIPDNLSRSTASDLWKYMYGEEYQEPVIAEIKRVSSELNLNDYLTFELTRKYVDTKFGDHTPFSRNVLKHFLLSNMGYDVRLAEAESGVSLILMPFNQMVYGRSFLEIDRKKYFIFSDVEFDRGDPVYTCHLPSDVSLGNAFELKLDNLNLPYKPYKYKVSYGGITISGEANGNIYPILHHYPQMPIGDYAQSVVDSNMRSQIISQLRGLLAQDSRRAKAEKLLHFTQYAFDYATDDESHGFEKPYFFEEIVFYPKCDCEDRAIFYSYLLGHVAGIENHIISYPGHEATALTLPAEELKGTSYDYDGKIFYISDPTYIGASTGMCMPEFESMRPVVDYICR